MRPGAEQNEKRIVGLGILVLFFSASLFLIWHFK
jgi:hypothetical protein